MTHLPHIVADLGLILAVAGLTTLVFKKIRQPVVLGYILAGLLVGPHVTLIPTVVDNEAVSTWSEIGVIFLLFSLGLEFSFKKLVKVGGSASITALVEIILMIVVGYVVGQFLGWSAMDCIFLGAILSMSSTTIIIRAFDEVGAKTKKFASLVFGILIVEDLVAILLMVLLTTIAVSQQFAGGELVRQIVKLVFFLILWFLAGIFFVPTFLKRTTKLLNDETLLIISIGMCLLMVMLAVEVGFSAALGAFIMGSILAETTQAERIEHLVKSVKDLFAAVFFVSVGMMIDPQIIAAYWFPILVVTLVTIFGKFATSAIGALLSGQSLKHAVQAGMSLAQIGEFSFIIASLGVSLKVTSDFLYPIAVAASAFTTFTTPYLIRFSGSFYNFLEKRLPQKWVTSLNRYSSSTQQLSGYSDWKILLRAYTINLVIHSVILIAIIILSRNFLLPFILSTFGHDVGAMSIAVAIILMLMTPFIWALAIRRIQREAYASLWLNRKINRGPLIMLEMVRIIVAVLHVGFLLHIFFSASVAFVIALTAMGLAIVIFRNKLQSFYDRIERRFLYNLNERENLKVAKPEVTPWDAHLADFEVIPESALAGKQLHELGLRELYGINIALIERGKLSIPIPDRHARLFPGDRISVIGTDDQLQRIKGLFEEADGLESESQKTGIGLHNFTVSKSSPLLHKTIRDSGLRAAGLVVGLERNNERILNPDSSMLLEDGDILWVAGNEEKLRQLVDH
ncbi:cation:proton antiporter [Fulvivirgaceae bacterium PWU4]|uniref:Cation:proton antiporter n=1 Tax=Chryseosolibacter histidini TaxID=2782349 RepID=A0AAP2DLZ4_9BACT|nr:cation:proton antiporter [Chryseosolibacter histidini]MBT1696434.1 cation:proton antiporter [Chryseosolibacter histidini]